MTAVESMRLLAVRLVLRAEEIDRDERTLQSAQLLVASRVLHGAVEVFLEWQHAEEKHDRRG